jgi:hypothetical protein
MLLDSNVTACTMAYALTVRIVTPTQDNFRIECR